MATELSGETANKKEERVLSAWEKDHNIKCCILLTKGEFSLYSDRTV
jgi:hypothetical protein